jgi:cytochrome oxidase Cu insertion factor (SCO1/SenC/PrrC family)
MHVVAKAGFDESALDILFISVDPWRDTVSKVKDYVSRMLRNQ